MFKGIYQGHTSLSKLFIFIGLVLVGFGLSTILAFIGVQVIFQLDVFSHPEILSDFSNKESVSALKFMQLLNSIGIFIFPALAYAYMTSKNFSKSLDLNKIPSIQLALYTLFVMLVSLPLINYLVEINEAMRMPEWLSSVEDWMRSKEDNAKVITKNFLSMDSFISLLVNILIIGIIPAVGEELLFRGIIQNKLASALKNPFLAIWISAFLFSAMHLQFYGFLPRFLLGALFGYLYLWSRNLWLPILAHLINNGGAVILQYSLGEEFMEKEVDQFGTQQGDWLFLIVSLVLLTVLVRKIQISSLETSTSPST